MKIDKEKIKCVAFDLDNTLLDRERAARRCMRWLVAHNRLEQRVGNSDLFYDCFDNMGDCSRSEFFHIFVDFFGIDVSPDTLKNEWFSMVTEGLVLYDHALDVLSYVRKKYETALLTNGPAFNQRRKLNATGLTESFDYVFLCEEIGYEKPDRRAFEYMLDKIGIEPQECVYVGDSLRNDIEGALNVGITPIWKTLPNLYNSFSSEFDGVVRIDNIEDVRQLL